ncbi:hypothetical protein N7462_008867 [Penicillium macrosclerotiorum]|uniref:uncharacterized protein n=1 Tax=Penicillium macrosclerotiorum TaxID=303699 RepID=UPI00254704C1|nr:uncharacterized protein N7462_008867 [Penicillium macrosclerotiorum]KAJ5675970.1 hypothetical protein N7462_008867 [Penicillium macrosclerotiorum]
MANKFDFIPKKVLNKPVSFNFQVPEEDIVEFKKLLELSKIGPATWWNQHGDAEFGVSRQWLIDAKEAWLTTFDWRKHEEYINKFPNFKTLIQDHEIGESEIHFAALFSAKEDAIPIIFMHGYPSSFTDFLPMMELLVEKYTPDTLPYHIIVPSLPDYGLSSTRNQKVEMTLERSARIMNQLMVDLGFGEGYVAQGGDLGSLLARIMSIRFKECKAFHLNMLLLNGGQAVPSLDTLGPEDLHLLKRTESWRKTGLAYALEHGTRPATVGLVISSSPLALLAWVGEKLMEWTDPRQLFPLDTILSMVSFYWFTNTFPRSLYHATLVKEYFLGNDLPHPTSLEKPLGYSVFPYDLTILPEPWARKTYPNLAFFNRHIKGGHFASIEQPEALLEDVETFIGGMSGSFASRYT